MGQGGDGLDLNDPASPQQNWGGGGQGEIPHFLKLYLICWDGPDPYLPYYYNSFVFPNFAFCLTL